MIYPGGKARQARKISELILANRGDRSLYMEPFLGGGSVAEQIVLGFEHSILSDVHEDLIAMWVAMQTGWMPPFFITKRDYESLAYCGVSPLRGWAGFAASYRSKWFGGWAGSATEIDYIGNNTRSLLRKSEVFRRNNALIVCRDYRHCNPGKKTVIYCDPPYANTLGYSGTGAGFSSHSFWRIADKWVEAGAKVWVSEFTAPAHWKCVHRFSRRITMDYDSQAYKSDRLYTRDV